MIALFDPYLSPIEKGTTTVENLLDSDDIRYMLDALKTLNVSLEFVKDSLICSSLGDWRDSRFEAYMLLLAVVYHL